MNQINYISQMTSIVERINNPPKLVQCIQTFNEEEFIGLTLQSIYDEVDQIIVIEGAVGDREDATNDGHSTDRTLEIIEDFKANHDLYHRVQLIKIKRSWKSLEEIKQTFLDITSVGDWLIINDCDEFYRPEDIKRLRVAIDRYPHAHEFIPAMVHFYRDFDHIARMGPEWSATHQRLIKNSGGMKYNSHPVVSMSDGNCSYFSPWMQSRRFTINNFIIFHFGYARSNLDEVIRKKQDYYEKELAKHAGANKKFDEKAFTFFNRSESPNDFLIFDKELIPKIMQQHCMFNFRDEQFASIEFEHWMLDKFYGPYMRGKPVGTIPLCMTGQAAPYMQFYDNRITI
jgi:hypothetical protein